MGHYGDKNCTLFTQDIGSDHVVLDSTDSTDCTCCDFGHLRFYSWKKKCKKESIFLKKMRLKNHLNPRLGGLAHMIKRSPKQNWVNHRIGTLEDTCLKQVSQLAHADIFMLITKNSFKTPN
jgi:hypothetical protein